MLQTTSVASTAIILFFLLLCERDGSFVKTETINPIDYLKKYGYLNSTNENNSSLSDVSEAIAEFQEYYQLNVDGLLNEETTNLMNRPRCGLSDKQITFLSSNNNKWHKKTIIWYYSPAHTPFHSPIVNRAIETAFRIWEQAVHLTFVRYWQNPDIVISFASRNHSNSVRCQKGLCAFHFDGRGGVLGHAYPPAQKDSCLEIHLDSSENWYFDHTPAGQYNFLKSLTHEIGHALGLSHSAVPTALMYAYYNNEKSTLDPDDIHAIQSLYGAKSSITTTSSTTTTTTPSSTTLSVTESSSRSINTTGTTPAATTKTYYVPTGTK